MKSTARRRRRPTKVIELTEVRARLRLAAYQTRVANVVLANREALSRLYRTGVIFSFHGAKAACDLLTAHQHLLKVVTLLNRLSAEGERRAKLPFRPEIFGEVDALMEKTHALTHRTGVYLSRLKSE